MARQVAIVRQVVEDDLVELLELYKHLYPGQTLTLALTLSTPLYTSAYKTCKRLHLKVFRPPFLHF